MEACSRSCPQVQRPSEEADLRREKSIMEQLERVREEQRRLAAEEARRRFEAQV